jgi:hypothetical protein
MKPERYPYSGKRKNLERQAVNSSVTFSGSKIVIKSQSITGVYVPSGSRRSGLLQSTLIVDRKENL